MKNVYVSVKNIIYAKKDYVCNPSTDNCENEKYLASIMNDSTIICDEVIESYKKKINIIPTNFNGKKVTCKIQSFCILVAFIYYYSIIDSC